MDGFRPHSYGDGFAEVYDDWYGDLAGREEAVTALDALAGLGPVLELGCGTGRLCLPLVRPGREVHGLDASVEMLDRLRTKPGAGGVVIHQADMAAFDLPVTRFSLVFVAFNSLFNVASAEGQAGCFAAVARHLAPGGRFVVECFVPDTTRRARHDTVELHSIGVDRVVLRVSRQEPRDQLVTGQHVDITEQGIRLRPWRLRYSTPVELDAMAAAAGLTLVQRWADWSGTPFDPDGDTHVSHYVRSAARSGQLP